MKLDWRWAISGAVVLALLVGAAVALWRVASGPPGHHEQYATFEEAKAAGAFERGLPEKCLPAGTHTHYIYSESGSIWGAFEYPPGTEDEFAARTTELFRDDTRGMVLSEPPTKPFWWHGGLNARGTPGLARMMNIRFFRCDGFVLSTDPTLNAAFYWKAENEAAPRSR